ncbi:glycosyltransferase family 4 protein [Calycomorphotria hydatis]|uniref:WecA-like glycosyltransferase n=1 Tax=Calycomorphotria hydatis TaxID=2528027 RepID=A0A517T7D4_9PLAN|nr:MraY family glycosyltransferase [Calycomorphotria hydatis]QDT64285.1 WecA-like glycosyltransferase [Calycomorphotria hydatis]
MWTIQIPEILSPVAVQLIAIASLVSVVSTSLACALAKRSGLLDHPDDGRKMQTSPVPLLGGLAISAALLITGCISFLGLGAELITNQLVSQHLVALLLSGIIFVFIGLWDDISPIRPWTKFIGQLVAAAPYALFGPPVEWFDFMGLHVVLGSFGVLFTLFWLVACANAVNLMDGLDGLAGTLGLIAAATIAVVAESRGYHGTSLLALMLVGSIAGFLCYNMPPAKIYLGDSGSLLIGFAIGALSLQAAVKTATGFAMTVPLILVSVPAFDTLMAIIRRPLSGKGIGEADRLHLHHRLLDRGWSNKKTLFVIASLSLVTGLITIVTSFWESDLLGIALCGSLLLSLIIGRVFGHHETFLMFKKAQTVAAVLAETSGLSKRTQPDTVDALTINNWPMALILLERAGVHRLIISKAVFDQENVQHGKLELSHQRPPNRGRKWRVEVSAGEDDAGAEPMTIAAEGRGSTRTGTLGASHVSVLIQALLKYLSADPDTASLHQAANWGVEYSLPVIAGRIGLDDSDYRKRAS